MRRLPLRVRIRVDRRQLGLLGGNPIVGSRGHGGAARRGGDGITRQVARPAEPPGTADPRADTEAVRLREVDAGDLLFSRPNRLEPVSRHTDVGIAGTGPGRLIQREQRQLALRRIGDAGGLPSAAAAPVAGAHRQRNSGSADSARCSEKIAPGRIDDDAPMVDRAGEHSSVGLRQRHGSSSKKHRGGRPSGRPPLNDTRYPIDGQRGRSMSSAALYRFRVVGLPVAGSSSPRYSPMAYFSHVASLNAIGMLHAGEVA